MLASVLVTSTLDAVILTLGPTVAIIASYVLSKRDTKIAADKVRLAAEGVAEVAKEASGKVDDVNGKLEVVDDIVNNRLTQALEAAEDERAQRIKLLERLSHVEERLAQALAREEENK